MSTFERDQVLDWTDIENVKSMYCYMKGDRNGWQTMFYNQEIVLMKLRVAVTLMTVPAIYGIVRGIIWLCTHIHFG